MKEVAVTDLCPIEDIISVLRSKTDENPDEIFWAKCGDKITYIAHKGSIDRLSDNDNLFFRQLVLCEKNGHFVLDGRYKSCKTADGWIKHEIAMLYGKTLHIGLLEDYYLFQYNIIQIKPKEKAIVVINEWIDNMSSAIRLLNLKIDELEQEEECE